MNFFSTPIRLDLGCPHASLLAGKWLGISQIKNTQTASKQVTILIEQFRLGSRCERWMHFYSLLVHRKFGYCCVWKSHSLSVSLTLCLSLWVYLSFCFSLLISVRSFDRVLLVSTADCGKICATHRSRKVQWHSIVEFVNNCKREPLIFVLVKCNACIRYACTRMSLHRRPRSVGFCSCANEAKKYNHIVLHFMETRPDKRFAFSFSLFSFHFFFFFWCIVIQSRQLSTRQNANVLGVYVSNKLRQKALAHSA